MIGFSRAWRRAILRILRAILPGTETLPGLDPRRLSAFLSRFLREAPWDVRLILHASAALFLVTPPLTVGRLVPALSLPEPLLERHANAIAGHRVYLFRQALLMLKTAACMCWGADPAARRALGYPPYGPDPGTWRVG